MSNFFGDSYKIKNRSFPVQGQQYTVEDADNLKKISRWAYGRDQVYDIINANATLQQRVNTGRIHRDLGGIPIVYKGDVIMIPLLDQTDSGEIEDIHPDFPDEIVVRINGKILHGFTTNSMERAINTIADTFSFTAPYIPEDNDSKLLDPYSYYKTEIFIDRNRFLTGTAESWDFESSEDSTTATIGVRSLAGVLCDCPAEDTILDYSGQTFKQIAERLLKPFGCTLELPYGDSGIIYKAKREVTEKVFEFLAKLAKNKGFILNSNSQGGIKLDRANITGEPILNLKQGDPNIIGNPKVSNDGQKRYSSFKAISQTRGNPGNNSIVKDTTITAYRPYIFSADNNEQGEIQNAALWERARSLARSHSVTITVSGWRDKNNKIILENNIVTLYYPKLGIHKETKYLIEKVTYQQNGKSATLTLVLPQAYTLDFPEVMPWQR